MANGKGNGQMEGYKTGNRNISMGSTAVGTNTNGVDIKEKRVVVNGKKCYLIDHEGRRSGSLELKTVDGNNGTRKKLIKSSDGQFYEFHRLVQLQLRNSIERGYGLINYPDENSYVFLETYLRKIKEDWN